MADDKTSTPLGAFSWNELLTPDLAASTAFYTRLFGWTVRDYPLAGARYSVFQAAGQDVGGVLEAVPWNEPRAAWGNYVKVADLDEVVRQVEALGGEVLMPPREVPSLGRIATFLDPLGALFSAVQYAGVRNCSPEEKSVQDTPNSGLMRSAAAMQNAKDLSKEAPRSPRVRIGGYALLARALDKCRAHLAGTVGDYHFDCPLDNMLFSFKGVKGADFKEQVEAGASDEQMAEWLNTHGTSKTPEEVETWSNAVESNRPYDDPEKRDWFIEQCQETGIDPAQSTLFDWLEEDDRKSYAA